MKSAPIRCLGFLGLVFAALAFHSPLPGEETTDMLSKALDLVHQVENPATPTPTDAQRIDLLNQAIKMAQEAPNHRLKGHRVLAIQAIRSAILEITAGDPNHKAAADLQTADTELTASVALAGTSPSLTGVPPPPASIEPPSAPPQSAAAGYINRGDAEMKKGDGKGAVADYGQAIQLDPKNIQAYLKRASANEGRDPQGATADFNQVIALDPKNREAYEGLATLRWMHQDYDGTIAVYDQLIAIYPREWDYYGRRALAKGAKGDLDGAIADYDQDVLLEPTDADGFHNRGDLKKKKGDLAGALADLNQAISLGMDEGYVYGQRADVEKALGNLTGALADYDKVIALDPKNDDAFVDLEDVYVSRGDIKLATRDLAGAISDYHQERQLNNQSPADTYFTIWIAEELQGNKKAADAELAGHMAPSADFTWFWPATVTRFLLGQMDEPAFIQAAASHDAKKDAVQHGQAWYYAGMKRLLAGDKSAAADDFRKSLATQRKDENTYFLSQAELNALDQHP